MAVNYAQALGLGGLNPTAIAQQTQSNAQAIEQNKMQMESQRKIQELAPLAAQGNADAVAELYGYAPGIAQGITQRYDQIAATQGTERANAIKQATGQFLVQYKQADPETRKQLTLAAEQNPLIDFDSEDYQAIESGNDMAVDFGIIESYGLDAYKQMFGGGSTKDPNSIIERQRLLQDTQSDDPVVAKSARIALGLDPRAVASAESTIAERGNVGQVAAVKSELKQAETEGKGRAETAQVVIDEGLDAAKGIPTLKRSIELLKVVETGGIDRAALAARQLFGVEGADEGELSANLGQAILGDLRATFGAAFTEREGARLEKIRANFGRSPESNRRLLNQALQIAERAAKKAIKRAVEREDYSTASELKNAMEFEFDFDSEVTPEAQQEINEYPEGTVIRNPSTGEEMIMRNGKWEANNG